MRERRRINIDHLITDEENPRFEAVSTEEDALYSILEDQSTSSGNKVLNLARDIAVNGLNASELLVVSPIKGTGDYRVREGNRRITAIKLSLDSNRIPVQFNNLVPQFEKLANAMQKYRALECYVCDDEEEIHRLLELRHGGEQDGIGTVKWSSTQKARFSRKGNPQTARPLALIKHLQEDYGKNKLWTSAASVPITNLGRFISTVEVRQALGIKTNGNDARYCGGHDELLFDVLTTVKQRGVGAIYSKQDRVRLVEEAAERIEPDWRNQQSLFVEQSTGSVDSPSDSNIKTSATNEMVEVSSSASDDPEDAAATANQGTARIGTSRTRKKPVSNNVDKRMFGRTLRPRGERSNNIYRAIDWIDEQYLKRPDDLTHLLPILGFSLRLLLETVAREFFDSTGEMRGDNSLRDFLKNKAKPMLKAKQSTYEVNDLVLASEWINGTNNLEAVLGKWAHGTLTANRDNLVRESELIALIIKELWSEEGTG